MKYRKVIVSVLAIVALSISMVFIGNNVQAASPADVLEKGAYVITQDVTVGGKDEINDMRKGINIASSKRDEAIPFSTTFEGAFELDFRGYSKTKGINDMDNLTIRFTEVGSNNTFDVFMSFLGEWQVKGAYGSTTVKLPGCNGFGGYDEDRVISPGGIYTHGSFSNTKNKDEGTQLVDYNKIKFDPSTMKVYAFTQGSYYETFDIDDASTLKQVGSTRKYSRFQKYNVSIIMSGIASRVTVQSPANLLLYSLNGQSLAGKTIVDDAAPLMHHEKTPDGVRNIAFPIAKPIVYDVVDGFIEYNGTVVVKNSRGVVQTVTNNTFTPTASGMYKITYGGVEDKAKNKADDLTADLTVYSVHPGTGIELKGGANDANIGVGTFIKYPLAVTKSSLYSDTLYPLDVKFKVTLGDEVISEIDKLVEPQTIHFTKEGTYTISYSVVDYLSIESRLLYSVVVDSKIPTMTLEREPESVIPRGGEFAVPSAKAVIGGKSIPVVSLLTFPDGRTSTASVAVLDMVGDYSLVYSAEHNGSTYTLARTFSASTTPSYLFENVRGSVIERNVTPPSYADQAYNGLKVTASRSISTIKMRNPIDCTTLTKDGAALIDIMPLTSELGKSDFNMIIITLTDVNDPSNVVNIRVMRVMDEGYFRISTVQASAGNNGYKGWEWGRLMSIPYKGTNTITSFYGEKDPQYDSAKSSKLYFDYKTRAIFAAYGNDKLEVLDLDKSSDVNSGKEWFGFSTGMAYMSVSATELTSPEASYMIFSVNGQALNGDYISGAVSPTISVDMKGNNSVPKGLQGTPYKVFDATANDSVHGNIWIKTNVYSNYGSSNQEEIEIKDDAFVPSKVGRYTIVYTSGTTLKNVVVDVVDSLTPLEYTLDSEMPTVAATGKIISIPTGKASGGSGVINVTTTVTFKGTGSLNEKVEVVKNRFNPTKKGNYEIKITLTDYLGQKLDKTNILIADYSQLPVVNDTPTIPNAIINNKTITFPQLDAMDYFSNLGVGQQADIEIIVVAGGATEVLVGRVYTPKFTGEQEIKVTYKAIAKKDKTKFVELSYIVKVINPQFKDDYFIKKSITSGHTEEYSHFSTKTNLASMQFVNPLFSSDFSLKFSLVNEKANLDGVAFTLTDSINSSSQVTFMLKKSADETFVYFGEQKVGSYMEVFGKGMLNVRLSANGNTLLNTQGGVVAKFAKSNNGREFEGFASGKIYVDIELMGVTGDTELRVYSLCGQIFDNFDSDYMFPIIIIDGELNNNARINQKIVIPAARQLDVLDPMSTLTVTITKPNNGGFVARDADISKPIEFTADQYGQYLIRYTARDSSGNPRNLPFAINVIDEIPPVITLASALPTAASVNKEVKIPGITVTDNNDKNVHLYIRYTDPYGRMHTITNNVFTPTMAGEYIITLFARDASYSYNLMTHIVTVT